MEKGQIYNLFFHKISQFLLADDLYALSGIIWISPRTLICRGLSSSILQRFFLYGTEFRVVFSSAEGFGTEFREFASIFVPSNGTPSCFSSAEGFGTEFWEYAYIFVPRNGTPSCFLFRGRVRNGIPRVCFYLRSTERNSELFSLPRKDPERNSEGFCSAEQLEFRRK